MKSSRMLGSVAVVAVLAASTAAIAGTGTARAASNCPAVSSAPGLVGTVTPAPSPGVDWSSCDLSGADLSGAALTNVNLAGADLHGAEFADVKITGSNLTGTNLEWANFNGAVITSSDLTGADISQAEFWAATLADVRSGGLTDPNGAPYQLPSSSWKLSNGYLLGPGDDFSGVNFPALAAKPDLSGWYFTGSNFTGANLTGVDLEQSNLTGVQFTNANLTKANLSGDNLAGTNLQGATLTGAGLTGVESGTITGTPAALPATWSLRGGYLLGPHAELVSASLAGADLTGVDLDHANLYLATLAGANLTNANLLGTGLLDGVDVTGAIWSHTTCPDGTNSDNDGGTCVNNNDDRAPTANPVISGPNLDGWYAKATITWNWTDLGGSIDPARCATSTVTTTEGAPAVVTATCWNVEGLEGTASASMDIENKPPVVTVTGVKAGQVYAAGHVPAAGCRTTDAYSGVLRDAKLTVTTTGSHGVGAFTAACTGGLNSLAIPAPPVTVKYTVGYGLSAFTLPKNQATVAKSTHSFPVTVKLAGLTASLAAKLSMARGVRATLSGPGISPVTVTLTWQPKTGTYSSRLPIPTKVKTGQTYQVTIAENVGTGLIVAPRLGATVNPGIVRFK